MRTHRTHNTDSDQAGMFRPGPGAGVDSPVIGVGTRSRLRCGYTCIHGVRFDYLAALVRLPELRPGHTGGFLLCSHNATMHQLAQGVHTRVCTRFEQICRHCSEPLSDHCFYCSACSEQECPSWCDKPENLIDYINDNST